MTGRSENDDHDPENPFGPEFDPADRWGSPEHDLGPRVEIPTAEDVDPDLAVTWWGSVVLANVALGGVAVGLMLGAFTGDWETGGVLVAIGATAGVALYRVVRQFERRETETETETGTDGGDGRSGDGEGDDNT